MGDQASAPSQVIALPRGGGAQRGLGEKFSPDLHTGTGNFTVPMAIPAGRNGFQPQLNLVYSTGNGNGLFGLGWAISIPGVARKTSQGIPRYRDDDRQLDERDTFILSGAEDLLPIADVSLDAATQTRYRPRTEGLFARIVHHHDRAAGADFWEVRTRDGLVSRYGSDPADRPTYAPEFQPGSTAATIAKPKTPGVGVDRVFAWKLTSTEDPFGNRIEYLYESRDQSTPDDESQGHRWDQPLLTQIRYVDFEENGQTRFVVTVRFRYEDSRADPFSDYRAGFEIRTTKRCRSILVETHTDRRRPVREYLFRYGSDAYSAVSLLKSVEVIGFDDDGNRYDDEIHNGQLRERQLPALQFDYTAFAPDRRQFAPVSGMELPRRSVAGAEMELVDLHGAGLPDVVETGNTIRYWRNLGKGRLDIPRPMTDAPAGVSLASAGAQLLDADGDGRADLMLSGEPLMGYFPLQFPARWSQQSFQRYRYAPSFNLEDPEVRLVDLDGDGVTDVLRSGARFECFFNHRTEGWDPAKVRSVERGPMDAFPNVSFSDPRIRFADMTGDGLQDIVLVHGGSVEYWPNLGHGNWGRRIHMRASPRFPFGYDPKRILMADVNGDGLADIVYVDHGKVHLWINQCGNGWAPPVVVPGTPTLTDSDELRLVDFLGSGTSGVLWSTDAGRLGPQNLLFLDFTGGVKPHLLNEMNNRLGAVTRIEYEPSTHFYLEDEKQRATRWRTPLPFPVHVVAKVEVIDEISETRLTTEYRYHHGYWDGAEREFRGFGMTEHSDTETLVGSSRSRSEASSEVPISSPTLTRTWFHLGPVGPEFGDWREDLDWSNEFWAGDAPLLDHKEFVTPFLRTLARDDVRGRRNRRDALRTLRGSVIRTELYALDGSPSQNRPYTVTESQYGLREIGPRIFFPHLRGQRTTQWERGDDPLTVFTFTEDYDEFGQARQMTSVACPRGWRNMTERPSAGYLATRVQTRFASPSANGPYIHDRVAVSTTLELTSTAAKTVREVRSDTAAAARVIAQVANYYDGAAFVGLEGAGFATVGQYGALTRTEQLIFTDQHLADALAGTGGAIPPWLARQNANWTAEYPASFRARTPALGGYVYYDGSDGVHSRGYFAATARKAYDFQRGAGNRGLVRVQQDALGHETALDYDPFAFLPTKAIDPVGLEVSAVYNRRLLQPERVIDPNGNYTIAEYNPLGLLSKTWVKGKLATEGDSQRPSVEFTYDFRAFEQRGEPVSVRTVRYEHHDTEAVSLGVRDSTIEMREYSDGFGRLLQTRTQAEDVLFGDAAFGSGILPTDPAVPPGVIEGRSSIAADLPNVVVSGWQVYDNKGRVAEKYEPFFDVGWSYALPRNSLRGRKATLFYDPRGHVVRTVNPDGSEQSVIYGIPKRIDAPPPTLRHTDAFVPTPWEIFTYDANDNAGRTHPVSAQAYRHHWNTPAHITIDALGRTIEAVQSNRAAPGVSVEEHRARTTYDIRGNPTAVNDVLRRTAFRSVFDLSNRRLRLEGIDAGLRLTFFDAAGNLVETRDGKGSLSLRAYDGANRLILKWVRDSANESVTLREQLEYGDGLPDQIEARSRNLRGKLSEHRDEAGTVTFERCDFKGNLLEKVRRVLDPDQLANPAFRVNWDAAAGPAMTGAEYRISTRYDALNRVVSIQYPQDVEGPSRKTLAPAYNRAGVLDRVALDGNSLVERIAYNAKGQRTLVVYGNEVLTGYEYDPDTSRPIRQWTSAFTRRAPTGYQPSATPLQNQSYEYDLAGNVIGITELVPGCGVRNNPDAVRHPRLLTELTAGDALVREFEYDALYRLTRATGREADNVSDLPPWPATFRPDGFNWGTPAVPNPGNARDHTRRYTQTYDYDPAGNLMKLRHDTGGNAWARHFGMSGFTPRTWRDKVDAFIAGGTPDWGSAGNRLTNFGAEQNTTTHRFDANGNLIQEFTNRLFNWDHADCLRDFRELDAAGNESKSARYVYDSDGQRVIKRVQDGGEVRVSLYIDGLFEHHFVGAGQNNTLHVMDNKRRVALVRAGPALAGDAGPKVQYHLGDHLDSAVMVIGGSTASADTFRNREEHFPYGETSFGSFGRKRYRFSGKERDEESGLGYYQARYYSYSLARWTSCDPIRSRTNLYVAFDNSPMTCVDRDGQQAAQHQMGSSDINGTPAPAETSPAGSPSSFTHDPVAGTVEGDDNSFEDNCFRNTLLEPFTRRDMFMLGGLFYGLAQTAVPGGELAPSPMTFFPDHEEAPWFEMGRGGGLQIGGAIKVVAGTGGAVGGTGASLTGGGALVGVPVAAVSVGIAEIGVADIALGTAVMTAAFKKAGQQPKTEFDRRFSEGERKFMRPEDRIDMRNAPKNSPVNAEGYQRNSKWYFSELLKKRPEVFSSDNKKLIEQGLSPIVDKQWLKFHREHASYEGDFLRHHHIDRGPIAVAIPRRFHEIFHSMLHYVN